MVKLAQKGALTHIVIAIDQRRFQQIAREAGKRDVTSARVVSEIFGKGFQVWKAENEKEQT